MLPQNRFKQFIAHNALFTASERILLAVSGGRDSVLMTRLFAGCPYTFGIAHCNFSLRGDDADGDEQFTKTLAATLKVPYYSTRFDTAKHAKQHRISVQMAARQLRYTWLEELRQQEKYDYIALAHHKTDSVETILLNLVRGTGIAGLHGIAPRRGKLIRPLLFLDREEITEICTKENISYRDDASNQSSYYARNKIRLEVLPKLKELNPSVEETFEQNIRRFEGAERLLEEYITSLRKKLIKKTTANLAEINIRLLKKHTALPSLLFELLKPFQFTEAVVSDLTNALDGQPGKIFYSTTHQLILDRNCILINSITGTENDQPTTVRITAADETITFKTKRYTISLIQNNGFVPGAGKHLAQLDFEKLRFPLHFRSWLRGDSFYPFGMKGKKKLSDFFQAEKVPVHQKTTIPVLVNGNGDIIWIAGYRIDERYKVKQHTDKIFILEEQ